MYVNDQTQILKGVFMQGVASGVKRQALDLAMIYVPEATGSAGVFTQHDFAASSVDVSKKTLSQDVISSFVEVERVLH